MIDVVNLQRKVAIDVAAVRSFSKQAVETLDEALGRTASIAFVSDHRMRELNKIFRNKDATTDVLSFPHEADEFEPDKAFLGDIVISAEHAQKQADENDLSLDVEIKQLILHGLLHLCGYDHETDDGEMDRRELALRSSLKIE